MTHIIITGDADYAAKQHLIGAAIHVDVHNCAALVTLDVPKATHVEAWHCPALVTLTAPKATSVDVRHCPALVTLDVPKATHVDVLRCPALVTLDVPKATHVDVRHCPKIGWLDPRGWSLIRRAGGVFFAGCRRFTAAEARAHWGSPEYPDPKRGAAFVAQINAEMDGHQ